ncbi:hypothetical protein RUND412_005926, partial [Rhizina undulata]
MSSDSPSSIPAPSTVMLCNISAANTATSTVINASPTIPMAKLMDAKGFTDHSLIPTNPAADVVSSKISGDTTTTSSQSFNQLQPVLANVTDEPDQILLEALEIQKDRRFLIKLEQDIINFILENKGETFELPPMNAYHRLLTHRMAEYYELTHITILDATGSSVMLCGGQFAIIPPMRLHERQVSSSSKDSPSNSTVPTLKIMKRDYKTRKRSCLLGGKARIFKDFDESSDVPQAKPNNKQKKSQKPDDFYTRSQFNPVSPPAPQVLFSFYPQHEDLRYHNQIGAHMPAPAPSGFNTVAAWQGFAP